MRVALEDVPVEVRAQAAWWEIQAGADPYEALHAALWPNGIAVVPSGEPVEGFCIHGHPWNEENTYINPRGWRRCRACARREKRVTNKKVRKKAECAYCGATCTHPQDKGTGGTGIPRCRKCFWAHYRARRLK